MRIFLAGGAGAIGRPFIRQAIARGHEVLATTRSPRKQNLLSELSAKPVVLDGLDAAAVGAAVARARPDAIVHQMTALSGTPDLRRFDRWFAETNRLRTEGTRHLLAAANATGVPLFAAQSYAGWPARKMNEALATEETPFAHPLPSQRETLAAIRFLEEAVTTAEPSGIVLRYGSLYGPGATDEMVRMVKKRMVPIIGGGTGVTSWTHVDDAAAATLAALERRASGIFNIVDDDPAPVAEWLPALADAVGASPPLRVPKWVGRLLAGEAAVRIMTATSGYSNARAKAALGWRPAWSSWRQGFRHALG
jgi:nucleoside-diphosphate-sugar epimerase